MRAPSPSDPWVDLHGDGTSWGRHEDEDGHLASVAVLVDDGRIVWVALGPSATYLAGEAEDVPDGRDQADAAIRDLWGVDGDDGV